MPPTTLAQARAYHKLDLIVTRAEELLAERPNMTLGRAMVIIINRESKL